jgi:DNA-binding NarL/FixJ family response regulator
MALKPASATPTKPRNRGLKAKPVIVTDAPRRGEPMRDIARSYNVNHSTIRDYKWLIQ